MFNPYIYDNMDMIVRTSKPLNVLNQDELEFFNQILGVTPGDGILVTSDNLTAFIGLKQKNFVQSHIDEGKEKAVVVLYKYILRVEEKAASTNIQTFVKDYNLLAPDMFTAFEYGNQEFGDDLICISRADSPGEIERNLQNHIKLLESSFNKEVKLYLIREYNPNILFSDAFQVKIEDYYLASGEFSDDLDFAYEEAQDVDGQRSASIGDIFEVLGELHIVLALGFKKIEWNDFVNLRGE